MGVTWLSVGLSCSLCLSYDGLAIGFGSRKTEYVDKIGTMKPILPKARMFMEHLPEEFRGGYVPWRDGTFMRISFPDTGSIIAGEGGDDIEIGTRRKTPTRARDNYGAHIGVSSERRNLAFQLVEHRWIEGVQLIRTVQHEVRHRAI